MWQKAIQEKGQGKLTLNSFTGSFKDSRAENSVSSIKRNVTGESSIANETERISVRDSQLFSGTRSFIIPNSTSTGPFGKKYSFVGPEERSLKIETRNSAVDLIGLERSSHD